HGAASPAATATPAPARAPDHLRVLFLRAAFPDQPSSRPTSDFHDASRSGLIDRLVSYWDEVSARRFHIDAIVSDRVYMLPKKRAAYVSQPGNMIRDTLALASRPAPDGEKALVDGSRADVVVVTFAGPGAESDIQKTTQGLPWSNAVEGPRFAQVGDKSIDHGMVVAEDPFPPLAPFGVMAHEFGHVLGLPELYAPNKPHEGIGIWGLMGQGTWVGRGDMPPHPEAWSKLTLGWVDPIVVDRTQTVTLPSVARSAQVVKIYAKGPHEPWEYFLIENREQKGADRRIPGPGLLIWHVDERLTSYRRSQDEASHKRVDLLTADSWPSHLDIGHANGGNRGDAGDPWVDRKDGPGPDTRPSTAAYDGTRGRFAIRNISPAGEVMTFDVVFEGDAAPSAPALDHGSRPPSR
ncbi:M6 family metalloprotease domain-containing protein, partial [Candidatus Binatia bacterium]|nr:M6 family metalloprotease domain-containing protein [Candidatus Binatia bacterium]